jgi:hypothetical protein
MAVYKRKHVLPSAAWVDGGNIQIPVRDLPPLARIEAFVFRFEALFTTGGAAAAIASTQLHRLMARLDIGPNVLTTGEMLHLLGWQYRGSEGTLPAGLPAANAEAHRRTITWTVPFYDPRALEPGDGCPIGADYNEKVISFDCAAFAGLGAGTWATLASLAGTLRVEAILLPPSNKVGSVVQFGFADLTGQSPTLQGTALYDDLFIYREAATTIDSLQVATVAIQGDGAQWADQVRSHEYASRFNELWAKGPRVQLASATVPEGGELLPEGPAVTAAAAATVTMPFVPVIFPSPAGKKSDSIQVEQVIRLDCTGTDTTYRVGYRRVLPHTEASLVAAFARRGNSVNFAQLKPATANGAGISGARAGLGRFLPVALA